MFLVIKRIFRMSALRQAVVLSLSFLVLLSAGGVLLNRYLTRELQTEIDDELRREFATISRSLRAQGQVPEGFGQTDLLSAIEMSRAFLHEDGTVSGSVKADVFKTNGLKTLQDADLFSEQTQREFFAAIEAELAGFESDDDTSTELFVGGEFDPVWRIFVGPALDGRLVVFAPTIGGLGTELSAVISIAVILLSIPTLAVGVIFGLRAQARLDRIGKGYERIADGDLSVRLAPTVVVDDLDRLTQRIDDATAKLQTSLRQMSEFSSNIAHDLRTPLTRLRVHLDQAEAEETLSDHELSSIEQVDSIISVFDSIQRIARLRTGERRAKFQPVNLGALVNHAAEIYEAVAEDEGRVLVCRLDNPATISGDQGLLTQLLANLIENAIKHTDQGATITIAVKDRILSVCDNGPGIPTKERPKVLEPLYRLETSRGTPGAGIGLAMVKAIADLHEAEIALSEGEHHIGLKVALQFGDIASEAK
ncbi:HAMP domain-containing sensor histidine kinase [Ruegeria sp. EL01]|jgi:signal transduction histidine kinase|uniref:sensor histidine kinase n=1 Tax=Ruegeria sp. EL01 TaxID=2107578 RepID=UPI0020B12215|nr:HAMP domain-containing sensor histidine kinase [Ruegeria sp. EL01]